ncbi:MAG TPA: 16S rRNA (cytidine(1402)-2'-O)-methyltransferase [Candidatus Krumholzibacteria bacterium]|nr:16S rRNA (cytidine(1402)-2'-O)-methyltransferase [Candidatus Krumholzibacteria bacterium]
MLTLVATPIGNLEDLSPRAQEALRDADQIYAEDTRHTGQMLARLQIKTRMRSCHDHNEEQRAREIIERLQAGENIALVSDAGTPGVADPGYRVVRAALQAGLKVSMIPGPSSVIMALVLSGFPSDRFVFDGWLPRRSGRLIRQLESYRQEERSVVLLESSHRLLKSLPHFAKILEDRELAVCREMTKLHEEVRRGSAADLLAHYEEHPPKGELVLVLAGASA